MVTRMQQENQTAAVRENRTQKDAADGLVEYLKFYAEENPGTAALWCFAVGFFVGWRLKPW